MLRRIKSAVLELRKEWGREAQIARATVSVLKKALETRFGTFHLK